MKKIAALITLSGLGTSIGGFTAKKKQQTINLHKQRVAQIGKKIKCSNNYISQEMRKLH